MNARRRKLLLEIAADFENAATPMNHDWLLKNKVSLDECGALCDNLGAVIKGFAQAPKELQTLILVCSAADNEKQADFMVNNLSRSMAMADVINRMKAVNKHWITVQ